MTVPYERPGGLVVQIVTNNDAGLRELARLSSTAHETVL